jgi:hypothetical protein
MGGTRFSPCARRPRASNSLCPHGGFLYPLLRWAPRLPISTSGEQEAPLCPMCLHPLRTEAAQRKGEAIQPMPSASFHLFLLTAFPAYTPHGMGLESQSCCDLFVPPAPRQPTASLRTFSMPLFTPLVVCWRGSEDHLHLVCPLHLHPTRHCTRILGVKTSSLWSRRHC